MAAKTRKASIDETDQKEDDGPSWKSKSVADDTAKRRTSAIHNADFDPERNASTPVETGSASDETSGSDKKESPSCDSDARPRNLEDSASVKAAFDADTDNAVSSQNPAIEQNSAADTAMKSADDIAEDASNRRASIGDREHENELQSASSEKSRLASCDDTRHPEESSSVTSADCFEDAAKRRHSSLYDNSKDKSFEISSVPDVEKVKRRDSSVDMTLSLEFTISLEAGSTLPSGPGGQVNEPMPSDQRSREASVGTSQTRKDDFCAKTTGTSEVTVYRRASLSREQSEVAEETSKRRTPSSGDRSEVAEETAKRRTLSSRDRSEFVDVTAKRRTSSSGDRSKVAEVTAKRRTSSSGDRSEVAEETSKRQTSSSGDRSEVAEETPKQRIPSSGDRSEAAKEITKKRTSSSGNRSEVAEETAKRRTPSSGDRSEVAEETAKRRTSSSGDLSEVAEVMAKRRTSSSGDRSKAAEVAAKRRTSLSGDRSEVAEETLKQRTSSSGDRSEVSEVTPKRRTSSSGVRSEVAEVTAKRRTSSAGDRSKAEETTNRQTSSSGDHSVVGPSINTKSSSENMSKRRPSSLDTAQPNEGLVSNSPGILSDKQSAATKRRKASEDGSSVKSTESAAKRRNSSVVTTSSEERVEGSAKSGGVSGDLASAKTRKASFDLAFLREDGSATVAIKSDNASNGSPPRKRKASFDVSATSRKRKASFDVTQYLHDDICFRGRSDSISSDASARKRKASFDVTQYLEDIPFIPAKLGSIADEPSKKRKASFDVAYRLDDTATLTHSVRSDNVSVGSTVQVGWMAQTSGSTNGGGSTKGSGGGGKEAGVAKLDAVAAAGGAALEHLDALGSGDAKFKEDDNSSVDSRNKKILVEALMMSTSSTDRRDRFESWGGMSDLSFTGPPDGPKQDHVPPFADGAAAAAALAASALQQSGLGVENAAVNSGDAPPSQLWDPPAPESCGNSIASGGSGGDNKRSSILGSLRKFSNASLSGGSGSGGSSDMMMFAIASMSDQLADFADTVEAAAAPLYTDGRMMDDKDLESVNYGSPLISLSDAASIVEAEAATYPKQDGAVPDISTITLDYDAVAAAVDAAKSVDISAIAALPPLPSATKDSVAVKNPRQLPSARSRSSNKASIKSSSGNASSAFPAASKPIPLPVKSDKDMEAIRERARAAAGYVLPAAGSKKGGSSDHTRNGNSPDKVPSSGVAATPEPRAPLKKRKKAYDSWSTPAASMPRPGADSTPNAAGRTPGSVGATPVISNTTSSQTRLSFRSPQLATPKNQSNQKWEDMFECLVQYVKEVREEAFKNLSEGERDGWEWEGNVPTTYKTKDGRALGRWVNNQRSAKHKGTLKDDRETRLMSTGLKWSVLSTNAWSDMMDELRLYVREKTKDGSDWDGNVPTNYRIKGNVVSDSNEADDDKNLGRWINRQRSLYQAGRLKKERQLELEEIGLRWSVLSTAPWHTMYEALREYANQRKKEDPEKGWDGNVPANYKTNDLPPKSLGRWVNRQRCAYAKNKLKKEFAELLDKIGLKWSVHERRKDGEYDVPEPDNVPSSDSNNNQQNQQQQKQQQASDAQSVEKQTLLKT